MRTRPAVVIVAGALVAAAIPVIAVAATPSTVAVKSTKLGKIVVDGHGHTLYAFEGDKGSKSNCNGACAMNWPPLLVSGTPHAGKGLTASKLKTTKRGNGKTQAVYGGHPLYTFVGDAGKVGSTKGQKVHAFGYDWYVVAPSGKTVGG